MRVLVTGATGFVGQGIIPALIAAGHKVRAAVRAPGPLPDGVETAIIGDLSKPLNRGFAFEGVDAVVHAAGVAHSGPGIGEDVYRRVNTDATVELAEAAARAGVRRFVFLSSVRAQSGPVADAVLTEDMTPEPSDPYGRSKLAAEQALAGLSIPFVVLRPVLIHGPGVRYNMDQLIRLARTPWPLPLGALKAKRSIVARGHLADAVTLALDHPGMAGGTYLVADPEPLSVAEMIAALRAGLSRRSGLVPVPSLALGTAARLMGRGEVFERLARPLIANPARLLATGWQPRLDVRAALAETARQVAGARA